MFIGREAELKFLNDKYEENGGQLIVLYGRRRVGKTETLREFCQRKTACILFLYADNRPGTASKLFNSNDEGRYSGKRLYLCVYRLGESVSGRT